MKCLAQSQTTFSFFEDGSMEPSSGYKVYGVWYTNLDTAIPI